MMMRAGLSPLRVIVPLTSPCAEWALDVVAYS